MTKTIRFAAAAASLALGLGALGGSVQAQTSPDGRAPADPPLAPYAVDGCNGTTDDYWRAPGAEGYEYRVGSTPPDMTLNHNSTNGASSVTVDVYDTSISPTYKPYVKSFVLNFPNNGPCVTGANTYSVVVGTCSAKVLGAGLTPVYGLFTNNGPTPVPFVGADPRLFSGGPVSTNPGQDFEIPAGATTTLPAREYRNMSGLDQAGTYTMQFRDRTGNIIGSAPFQVPYVPNCNKPYLRGDPLWTPDPTAPTSKLKKLPKKRVKVSVGLTGMTTTMFEVRVKRGKLPPLRYFFTVPSYRKATKVYSTKKGTQVQLLAKYDVKDDGNKVWKTIEKLKLGKKKQK